MLTSGTLSRVLVACKCLACWIKERRRKSLVGRMLKMKILRLQCSRDLKLAKKSEAHSFSLRIVLPGPQLKKKTS